MNKKSKCTNCGLQSAAKTPENAELKREYIKTIEQAAKSYAQIAGRQNSEEAKMFAEKSDFLFEQSRRLQQ